MLKTRIDRIVIAGMLMLFVIVSIATFWSANIAPAMECHAHGGTSYWRRDHWWQKYGTFTCDYSQE